MVAWSGIPLTPAPFPRKEGKGSKTSDKQLDCNAATAEREIGNMDYRVR